MGRVGWLFVLPFRESSEASLGILFVPIAQQTPAPVAPAKVIEAGVMRGHGCTGVLLIVQLAVWLAYVLHIQHLSLYDTALQGRHLSRCVWRFVMAAL